MFTECIADQRRAILLLEARGPIGGAKERFIEDDLHGFHMWSLLHSLLHSQRKRGLAAFPNCINAAVGT